MGRVLVAVGVCASVLCGACAGDPAIKRWSDEWLARERAGQRGEPGAAEALADSAQDALTPADVDLARFGQARALRAEGRTSESFALFTELGNSSMRRIDRSRARYETARMAEAAGRRAEAVRIFRRVVQTYPNQAAAMQSLRHLEHIAADEGPLAEADALRWSRRAYRKLARTPVGDDLAFMAAATVYRWWRETGREVLAERAESLLLAVEKDHVASGHWDDAVWMLSHLYHRQGRYREEVRALGRIYATREDAVLVGHYDTTYHWVGRLRTGRLQLLLLDDPVAAADTYASFVSTFVWSRWRDDARFWQGCALLRAGDAAGAEEAFGEIAGLYADSKYLARLDAARAEPFSAVCEPKDFEEGSW
ncbi:MAG: tetratricopeptide repeat protein [Myxococcota bacterium]|jgi:tetratricopeptide (TPR) repeat protein|nr:tetratricopeptide repeat protein [Myxococcota bacterium]